MKRPKNTDRNAPKRIPSVGPITSREVIGPTNMRTALMLAWQRAERRSVKEAELARRLKAAITALGRSK